MTEKGTGSCIFELHWQLKMSYSLFLPTRDSSDVSSTMGVEMLELLADL